MTCRWKEHGWDYDNPHLQLQYVDRLFEDRALAIFAALTKDACFQALKRSISDVACRSFVRNLFPGMIPVFKAGASDPIPDAPWVAVLGCGPAPEFVAVKVMTHICRCQGWVAQPRGTNTENSNAAP